VDVNIPLGTLTLAEQTRNVHLSGNLNSSGALPTQGADFTLDPFTLVGGGFADATSLLTNIDDPAAPGTPLYSAGQIIELTGAMKGSKTVGDATLQVGAATTVQDFLDFLNDALGIIQTGSPNPDGSTPGVTINPADGVITVIGNTGSFNDITLDTTNIRLNDAAGTFIRQPVVPSKIGAADGESVRTTFVVFDSLGSPLTVDITLVKEDATNAGTTWRYYAESGDDTDAQLSVGTGTLTFDPLGQLSSTNTVNVQIDRDNTGAVTPLTIALDFDSQSGSVTALDGTSALASVFQDGSPVGTLASYSVGTDGTITGAFDNGLTRTIGQIAMATFSNPEGLVDIGSNLFVTGPNSGTAVITSPLTLGAGKVLGGALELSNVDLSQEFINLILASTGFSASSRVITTTDQLIQQLLVLGR
jgi:flagellar hook protein FlgE